MNVTFRTRDLGLALLLAALLGIAWTVSGWAQLAALNLPDTDDVMRLQQVRDWLGGQAFSDLAQHRLGLSPGLEMHWSRLGDLGPAVLIVTLEPMLGPHGAEVAAVIGWPVALFGAALALVGGIARRLDAPAPVAIVVAALAYPATTLFMPGRIDHHALQMVLLLVVVRAMVGPGTLWSGIAAGVATALSVAIGLETAPLLAVAAGAMCLAWVWREAGAQDRLLGFGGALVVGFAAAAVLLRTSGWNYPACDGFTAQAWRAAQIGALAPLVLALLGFAIADVRGRLIASVLVGGAAGAFALWVAPGCLHPYGAVDPVLARLWLANVGEAQSVAAAPLGLAIGYLGLGVAGAVAAIAQGRDRRWASVAALQVTALALACVQLRGAYAAALLAAPALAVLIARARARGPLWMAGAWIVSAGLVYPMVGARLATPVAAGTAGCDRAGAIAALARLPAGTVLAPIDLSAYALAATPHRFLAGPYHRNNAGNLAAYRALTGGPATGFDYLLWCGGFPELGETVRLPAGMTRIVHQNGFTIYRATTVSRLRATGQVS